MITCHLQNIILRRQNGFTLRIDDLTLPPQKENGKINKIPFMGVSGAGKSTLLNIMAAIEWPHEGRVTWTFPDKTRVEWTRDGLSSHDAKRLRREFFGFAFQDSTLMPQLSIGDNLCYPLLLKGCSRQDAHRIAANTLEKVLLGNEKKTNGELFKRFPFELSGGQKQRVALVQAMIHDPCVLFADEPTGSLDRKTRQQVMGVLLDWVNEPAYQGKRVLLWVTHHENDPRDANVQWKLCIENGHYEWEEFHCNERRTD